MAEQEKTIELGVVPEDVIASNVAITPKETRQNKSISAKVTRIAKEEVWVIVDGFGKIVPRSAIAEDTLKIGDTVSIPAAVFKPKKK
ncbi:MAG: hypothetical protein NC084_06210 [Bacteroides sp.]|nr:hypothetical protein [Eubacterium sp.]MCM1418181.1 hypothetical protein [Roseburia sp.]MCM1462294.1 hypothetical protein [Bacteroides sp.]